MLKSLNGRRSLETPIEMIKQHSSRAQTLKPGLHIVGRIVKPGFHYTANATTTTQKQSDYKVEQSSFMLIALF